MVRHIAIIFSATDSGWTFIIMGQGLDDEAKFSLKKRVNAITLPDLIPHATDLAMKNEWGTLVDSILHGWDEYLYEVRAEVLTVWENPVCD